MFADIIVIVQYRIPLFCHGSHTSKAIDKSSQISGTRDEHMTLICPDIDQFVCLAERSLQAVPKASIINLFVLLWV
jgi:hypothetical protein